MKDTTPVARDESSETLKGPPEILKLSSEAVKETSEILNPVQHSEAPISVTSAPCVQETSNVVGDVGNLTYEEKMKLMEVLLKSGCKPEPQTYKKDSDDDKDKDKYGDVAKSLTFKTPLRLAAKSNPSGSPPNKRHRKNLSDMTKPAQKCRSWLAKESEPSKYLENISEQMTDFEDENHRTIIYGLLSMCIRNNWKYEMFTDFFRDKVLAHYIDPTKRELVFSQVHQIRLRLESLQKDTVILKPEAYEMYKLMFLYHEDDKNVKIVHSILDMQNKNLDCFSVFGMSKDTPDRVGLLLYRQIVSSVHHDKNFNDPNLSKISNRAAIFIIESHHKTLKSKTEDGLTRDENGRGVPFKDEVLTRVQTGEYLHNYYEEIERYKIAENVRQKRIEKWKSKTTAFCNEHFNQPDTHTHTDLKNMIMEYNAENAPTNHIYIRYWTRDVLYRRALTNSSDTTKKQTWLQHKAIRDSVLDQMFPRTEVPRVPAGSSRIPNAVKGYVLDVLNKKISEEKKSSENLQTKMMLKSSSSFELDLGVTIDRRISERSCVIENGEAERMAKKKILEQSLSIRGLKDGYAEIPGLGISDRTNHPVKFEAEDFDVVEKYVEFLNSIGYGKAI